MLVLNTGTPGAGKTLFTLWTVENRRKKDNEDLQKEWVKNGSDESKPAMVRDVYYFNIKVKKLPWIELKKPEDWLNCPVGSIIVFDECQEAFPPRANSATPPVYVSELAKARHGGYDLYFITQHPTFTDPYVRKLTEQHNHLMRPWGAKKAVVHTWKGVKDNCDKTRKDSLTSSFGYPKEVYEWYKSAEVHTHKFKLPPKVWAMILIPFLIVACVYGVYSYFQKKIHPENQKSQTAGQNQNGSVGAFQGHTVRATFDASSFKPRIDDLPWTAPRYDELTQPTVAPIITGCVVFKGMCKCLTQQGTTHHATMQFCLATIENGLFQDFDGNGGGSKGERKEQLNQSSLRPSEDALKPSKDSIAASKPPPVDSGFNLPITPPATTQRFQTHPSGVISAK
jgi:zona occludens toxin